MSNLSTWILTFDRSQALNRQIDAFKSWTSVHIFTNHPRVSFSAENLDLYDRGQLPVLHNTLSDPEATAYTARAWNNIFLKGFKDADEMICVQDDTFITNPTAFRDLILGNKDKYDLIWGPAGDQFFYIKKKVVEKIGFFDERFSTGAFCGDADFLKRIWLNYDRDKLSIVEKHDFGFSHNSIGIENIIPTDIRSKAIDANYVNQHQEIQKIDPKDEWLHYAQDFWKQKWGHPLNGVGSMTQFTNPPLLKELWLYPWFVKKYLKIDGVPPWSKV